MKEKIYYNKLVRDKIPQRIEKSGGKYAVNVLNDDDFKKALLSKVGEEASGLEQAKDKGEVISELGDILDVIDVIKKTFKISPKELSDSRKKEFKRKGGFKKRLFLLWAEDTGLRLMKGKENESSDS